MDFYQKSRLHDIASSDDFGDSLVITYAANVGDVFLHPKAEKVFVAFSSTKKGDSFVPGISLNCGMKQINGTIQRILTFGPMFWDHTLLYLKFQFPKLDWKDPTLRCPVLNKRLLWINFFNFQAVETPLIDLQEDGWILQFCHSNSATGISSVAKWVWLRQKSRNIMFWWGSEIVFTSLARSDTFS